MESPPKDQQHTQQIEQEQQPLKYHIGVKSCRVSHNIYNTLLLSYTSQNHLIVNHGEDLLIYNSKSGELTKTIHHNHAVSYIKVTHSQKWKCLFLLDTNQKLAVYSYDELLLLAKDIDLKSVRHCLDFMYLDEYNAFLVLTPEHLKLVQIEINSNHLRSLFANAYKFKMKETRVKVLQSSYFLQFSNRIRRFGQYLLINNSENLKIIWHSVDHNFNGKQSEQDKKVGIINEGLFKLVFGELPHASKYSKKTIIHLSKICQSPQQITEILYNPQQCILVCGSNQGDLKVFKINTKNIIATTSPSLKSRQILIQSQCQLAFKLSLHNAKPVISIQMYSPKLILSVGADEYIQVISFDQMASIERFKSSTHLASISFVSNSTFLAVKTIQFDQFLYSYEIALNYELLVQHNSQVLHALFRGQKCVLVLTDNSLNVLQLKQNKGIQKNKATKKSNSFKKLSKEKKEIKKEVLNEEQDSFLLPKQSFVPPRCKSILGIETYPYSQSQSDENEQFWILTDESQIYRYAFVSKTVNNEKTSKFEIIGIHELYHFMDTYKHETKQKVCKMKFIDMVPVYYDSDIRQKKYFPNFNTVDEVKPIVFGCFTGELLVCSSIDPTNIISRVRCFGEPINFIVCCQYPNQPPVITQEAIDNDLEVSERPRSPHVRRLIIFSSYKQIVAVMLSNYLTPSIIYKILLNDISFVAKPLSPYLGVILNGNIPKILFPCYKNANRLRLWTPQRILHENAITCLEYCSKIKVVSGDEIGKIVVWNMHSQILATILVSEKVITQICYCWNQTLLFGYNGKIFQLEMDQTKVVQVQPQQLISNHRWVAQFTNELSLNSNSTYFQKLFVAQKHKSFTQLSAEDETTAKMKKVSFKVSNGGLKKSLQKQQSRPNKSVEKYVQSMRKSLIKLSHEVETHQAQAPNAFFSDRQGNQINVGKKRKKYKSTTKHSAIEPTQHFEESQKIKRAKSILGKFKEIEQRQLKDEPNKNDVSLPQIKNASISLKSQYIEELETSHRKKSKNNKYEFLFHFPNTGLYTKLISKNMLD